MMDFLEELWRQWESFAKELNQDPAQMLIGTIVILFIGYWLSKKWSDAKKGRTELMRKSRWGSSADIIQYLIDRSGKESINIKDNYAWTALMFAAIKGHSDIVKVLLDNGSDINAKNDDGKTALMLAAIKGHTNVVKQILHNKAIDVNAKDNKGNTALMLSAGNGHSAIVNLLKQAGAKD